MKTDIKGLREGSEIIEDYRGYIIVRLPSGKYCTYGVSDTGKALAVYFWNKSHTGVNTRSFESIEDAKFALDEKDK